MSTKNNSLAVYYQNVIQNMQWASKQIFLDNFDGEAFDIQRFMRRIKVYYRHIDLLIFANTILNMALKKAKNIGKFLKRR